MFAHVLHQAFHSLISFTIFLEWITRIALWRARSGSYFPAIRTMLRDASDRFGYIPAPTDAAMAEPNREASGSAVT